MTDSSASRCPPYSARDIAAVPGASSHVRGDRLIGALVSLSLIVGGAWLGELSKDGRAKSPAHALAATTEPMVMPWIEPDVPDDAQHYEKIPPADVRPPMQPDVPQFPNSDAIVQPFEPPPPDVIGINHDSLTIPPEPGQVDTGKIFDPAQLDRQPVPISQTRPTYPFEMRRNGISGQVVVDFIVDSAGRVHAPYAAGSTNREFESAAVEAVSKWKFQPGQKGGRAVRTHMQVPIVFSLHNDR